MFLTQLRYTLSCTVGSLGREERVMQMVADRDRKMIMGTYAHFIDARSYLWGVRKSLQRTLGLPGSILLC